MTKTLVLNIMAVVETLFSLKYYIYFILKIRGRDKGLNHSELDDDLFPREL